MMIVINTKDNTGRRNYLKPPTQILLALFISVYQPVVAEGLYHVVSYVDRMPVHILILIIGHQCIIFEFSPHPEPYPVLLYRKYLAERSGQDLDTLVRKIQVLDVTHGDVGHVQHHWHIQSVTDREYVIKVIRHIACVRERTTHYHHIAFG